MTIAMFALNQHAAGASPEAYFSSSLAVSPEEVENDSVKVVVLEAQKQVRQAQATSRMGDAEQHSFAMSFFRFGSLHP